LPKSSQTLFADYIAKEVFIWMRNKKR
jgi:hypothetical protein